MGLKPRERYSRLVVSGELRIPAGTGDPISLVKTLLRVVPAIQNSDVGGSVRELSEPVELFSIAWLVGTAGRIELPFEISRLW